MSEFLANIFGNVWGTLIMSLIPLIELKGGIVFARGVGFLFWQAFGLAFVGSTIVFVPVYYLLRPILNLLKKTKFVGKLAQKAENYFNGKAQKTLSARAGNQVMLNENQNDIKSTVTIRKTQENARKNSSKMSERARKMLGVFIFVAIPLPMTGVWTGTAIAVFLNLNFKEAILPIAAGNLVAGLIISLLAELCLYLAGTTAILDYILWGLFGLALIVLIITIIKIIKSDKQNMGEKKDNGSV